MENETLVRRLREAADRFIDRAHELRDDAASWREAADMTGGHAATVLMRDALENERLSVECEADSELFRLAADMLKALAQPEQCICAAIQLPNGEVWRGHRHDGAIITAGKAGATREDIANAEQGFITSRNRFVGRKEGARLQAIAGIVSPDTGWIPRPDRELFSEDLYDRSWRSPANVVAEDLPGAPSTLPIGASGSSGETV
jgi:hypothetical protein